MISPDVIQMYRRFQNLVIQKKKKKFALGLSKSQKMLPHCENADRVNTLTKQNMKNS